jgi:hypothetical protein
MVARKPRSSLRGAVAIVGAALAAAQLVPVERANPPVEADIDPPPEVAKVLRRACYDCHSHETRWPWYAWVAPASWLVSRDVREGRRELDLSRWNAYDPKKQSKKLKEIWEEVAEGEMPPLFYRLLHPEARLDERDKNLLQTWVQSERARLAVRLGPASSEADGATLPAPSGLSRARFRRAGSGSGRASRSW